MYSPVVVSVFIFLVSFRFFVPLPQRKGIVLRVLTNDEVTHLRHGRLFHANFAAKFFDLGRRFLYRGYAHVVCEAVFWTLSLHHSPVGRRIGAACIDVPVRLWSRETLDLPAK